MTRNDSSYRFFHDYPVVTFSLGPQDQAAEIEAIIDPASPITIIPPKFVEGVDSVHHGDEMKIIGAVDRAECHDWAPVHIVNARFGDHRLERVMIVAYDLSIPDLGIIGQNILQNCRPILSQTVS